jgi:hypothetical protein
MDKMIVEQENQYIQDRKTAYETSRKNLDNLFESFHYQHFTSIEEELHFFKNDYFPLAVTTLVNKWIWRFKIHFPIGSTQQKADYVQRHLAALNYFF